MGDEPNEPNRRNNPRRCRRVLATRGARNTRNRGQNRRHLVMYINPFRRGFPAAGVGPSNENPEHLPAYGPGGGLGDRGPPAVGAEPNVEVKREEEENPPRHAEPEEPEEGSSEDFVPAKKPRI